MRNSLHVPDLVGRGQARLLTGSWWVSTASAIWSHRLWLIAVAAIVAAIRALRYVFKAAAPAVGEGLRPHVVELSDALGERVLSRLARRIAKVEPGTRVGTRADGTPLAQMQLDLSPRAHAYDQFVN
jgi:hypothetical protein